MKKAEQYGAEIGRGIKEGIQGINTACSPKKRKTCIRLILIPLALTIILLILSLATKNDTVIGLTLIPALCMGACPFYTGKFKRGLLYTITFGGFFVCALIDLFKLTVTKTYRDANGFPVIY